MALNFGYLLTTFLALLLVSLSFKSNVLAVDDCIPGGWCPDDPNSPTIIKIGNFSVNTYNLQANASLVFDSVVEAQSQVVAGFNYRLVIKEGSKSIASFPHVYEAFVYEGLDGQNDLYLKDFKKLTTV